MINASPFQEVKTQKAQKRTQKRTKKNTFDLRSSDQELTFAVLKKMLRDQLGIVSFSKDILASLGLYDKENGYNKAAELLADINHDAGIDAIRFGSSISIILDRVTFDNRSILEQYEGAVNLFCKYYQYEEITGSTEVAEHAKAGKTKVVAILNKLVESGQVIKNGNGRGTTYTMAKNVYKH